MNPELVPAEQDRASGSGPDISRVRLAVVSPMANEVDSAERFVREVVEHCCASGVKHLAVIAILDRVSRDGTLELLRGLEPTLPPLRVVYAPQNRCVVDAYLRGYAEALHWGADWVLEMDAGFSHLPAQIPRFLHHVDDGSDCVFATRFANGGSYEGGLSRRFLVSWLGSWLSRVLLGMPLTDMTSGFQLFSRQALQLVVDGGLRSRGPFFQTEIKTRLRDFAWREVPISYVPTGQVVRRASITDALRVLAMLFFQRLRSDAGPPVTVSSGETRR